ncbi:MAG: hypothetical protein EOO81_04735, partial [Oxalobacteraceae bacterium]
MERQAAESPNGPQQELMTKSDQVRALAAEGLKPAEIAARLGIRYQHAYNVLNQSRPRSMAKVVDAVVAKTVHSTTRPSLTVDILLAGGFVHLGQWVV